VTAGDMLAVVRVMRRLGPTTMRKVAKLGKIDERIAKDAIVALEVFGLAEERRLRGNIRRLYLASDVGDDDVRAAHVQWVTARASRHLPVMQPGSGDRRDDCAAYDECLDAFARSYSDKVDGHCPPTCERFAPFADGWRRMGHDSAARKEWA
jgi:hypothetical protein